MDGETYASYGSHAERSVNRERLNKSQERRLASYAQAKLSDPHTVSLYELQCNKRRSK